MITLERLPSDIYFYNKLSQFMPLASLSPTPPTQYAVQATQDFFSPERVRHLALWKTGSKGNRKSAG